MEKTEPNPIDVHVGRHVRLRRKELGISQENLARVLDLSFQQVQKYERGDNRISASKLYEIAHALSTSISFFFKGLPEPAGSTSATADSRAARRDELFATAGGVELADAFLSMNTRVRQPLVSLAEELGRGGN